VGGGTSRIGRASISFAAVAGTIAFSAIPAHAGGGTTYTVNTRADGSGPCTPSHCTLRGAIEDANANPGFDRVKVPGGRVYPLTAGPLSITDAAAVRATGARRAIVNGKDADRVLGVDTSNNDVALKVALDSLRLTHGAPFSGSGGALSVVTGLVVLRNSAIVNSVSNSGGGGIFVNNPATLVLRRSTVARNTSQGVGGGIANFGTVGIQRSTIVKNHTGNFGGGVFSGYENARLHAMDSTITRNSSDQEAAGLSNYGTATLNSVTIARNDANLPNNQFVRGGGIVAGAGTGGTVRITNSLVALNTIGSNGEDPDCYGDFDSLGYNLLGEITMPDCTGFDQTGDFTDSAPMLGPLADNGGPTKTIALLPDSPAIDAANPATSPATDQRSVPRDSQPDIGAFEFTGAG
jgi:CSLREA domain-containing protein